MGVSMFLSLFLQILDEIEEQGIKTYELPDCESDEDEDYVEQTKQLKVLKYIYCPTELRREQITPKMGTNVTWYSALQRTS